MQVTSVILIISEVSYVNWSLWKFSHYLLISMPMETLSGASQKNSVAAFSSTTEADGDFFKNMKWLHSPRSVLISRINWLIILPINCQKERAHHNFPEPKGDSFVQPTVSSLIWKWQRKAAHPHISEDGNSIFLALWLEKWLKQWMFGVFLFIN